MPSIVLTGFMGTGKTSTGQALAALLDREFVDMDEVIAAREHMSISEIFETFGEAHFRERERALCKELAARDDLVIATGGGALLAPENRECFRRAHVICLDASADEILRRLDGAGDRPLLNGDPRARIQALLAARREAYAQIPHHIATDGMTPAEVAREIVERLSPRTLRVRTPDGSYPIYLGRGLLARVGELVSEFDFSPRAALVTNPTVGALYAARVETALTAAGLTPTVVQIPDGEQFKTLGTASQVYDQLVAARLERRSPVFALGGGVVGDLAGFVAATFLRGVPLVQIPTTLLAMTDASVGGKVGVDHPGGKNLIGAFKFPHAVISDLDTLASLSEEEYRSGMAEVVKHSIIGDRELFNLLKTQPLDAGLLARALSVKIRIVEQDPFEESLRAHLNLGHTFGHALETLSQYQLRHGYAVSIGISVAARLAARITLCAPDTRDAIIELLEQLRLPTRLPREFTPDEILAAMRADKKVRSGALRLILPRAIGEVVVVSDLSAHDITSVLEESYPPL